MLIRRPLPSSRLGETVAQAKQIQSVSPWRLHTHTSAGILGWERLARATRQLHQPVLGSLQSSRIGTSWLPVDCSLGSQALERARQLFYGLPKATCQATCQATLGILAGCTPPNSDRLPTLETLRCGCLLPIWGVCKAAGLVCGPHLGCLWTAALGVSLWNVPRTPEGDEPGRNRWCRLPARKCARLSQEPWSAWHVPATTAPARFGQLQSSRIALWASTRLPVDCSHSASGTCHNISPTYAQHSLQAGSTCANIGMLGTGTAWPAPGCQA